MTRRRGDKVTRKQGDKESADFSGATGELAQSDAWVRHSLQPIVVGIMVACVATAIVQFGNMLNPMWNGTYLVPMPVFAALTGHFTYRIARRRYLSGTDLLQFQGVELLVLFVITKVVGYFDNSLNEIIAEMRAWPKDITSFFNIETLVAFALVFAGWFSAWYVAHDMEEFEDPALYKQRDFVLPLERMRQKFLLGGIILLFFSGAIRTEHITQLDLTQPRLPGLAFNALIYFVGGLIIFAQLRFARLSRLWQSQKTHFTPTLRVQWTQYSLIIIGIVLIIAFLLPTGYTIGFLQLIRLLISLIANILSVLSFLILMPLLFLASLFRTAPGETQEFTMPQSPFPELADAADSAKSLPLPEIARSLFFWFIALGALWYIMRSYLRDRPELWQTLQKFRLVAIVRTLWLTLRRWWRGISQGVSTQVKRVAKRLQNLRKRGLSQDAARRSGDTQREQIQYHYLKTLDQAKNSGHPRHHTETPYEYEAHLSPQVNEAQAALDQLTHAFVEARYSTHPVSKTAVMEVKDAAREVQRTLKEQNGE